MRAEISTIRIDAMAHKMPFRYRSHEVSRLEAFSDVIFGFALSLIVVSLEVPKTYGELMETVRGVLPFGFCFLIFIGLWLAHHEFFRRYGLQDKTTMALNITLSGLTAVLGNAWFHEGGQTPLLTPGARFAPIDLPGATALERLPIVGTRNGFAPRRLRNLATLWRMSGMLAMPRLPAVSATV